MSEQLDRIENSLAALGIRLRSVEAAMTYLLYGSMLTRCWYQRRAALNSADDTVNEAITLMKEAIGEDIHVSSSPTNSANDAFVYPTVAFRVIKNYLDDESECQDFE